MELGQRNLPSDTISADRKRWAQELKGLSNNVREMTSWLTTFKKSVELLGSDKDTPALRSKLKASRERLQTMARQNSKGVKELSLASDSISATDRATHGQIVREFHSVIKEFQRAQRVCIEREAMYTPKMAPRQAEQEEEDERSYLLSSSGINREDIQNSLIAQMDAGHNASLIDDRNQGITEIQSQITEVNEIFQDLHVLVSEQGHVFDDIEKHITRTSSKTKEASVQLKQADDSSKKSRNRVCYFALFLVFVLAVLIFVLVLILTK
eukprot:CAMPEP_0198206552 /NCGR_PEP_ID=MMETSP1445-20131203/10097_1 /TAXON_ID=36898 /ORGANISM="Pyramimonas sp., Strain CCMP2087" /LENGTH=267 /DNA_ID=CAMNT_0043879297 /DNA_START=421 /DNA_END=1224 /DNA_ORIENTATION=+